MPQTQMLEKALSALLESKTASNAEIYRTTLEHGFLPKHANEVLGAWQKAGKIVVDPSPPRIGVFYLGYENHEKNGRIVRISKVS